MYIRRNKQTQNWEIPFITWQGSKETWCNGMEANIFYEILDFVIYLNKLERCFRRDTYLHNSSQHFPPSKCISSIFNSKQNPDLFSYDFFPRKFLLFLFYKNSFHWLCLCQFCILFYTFKSRVPVFRSYSFFYPLF